MPRNNIYYHVRTEDGTPYATFAAHRAGNGKFTVGWARCSKKDNFSKAMGRQIALGRATCKEPRPIEHTDLLDPLDQFIERACRYFKGSQGEPGIYIHRRQELVTQDTRSN